jgi:sec-independent protein translocase protein TatC
MNVRGRTWKSDDLPLLDHLEELRRRILWSLLALVVGTVVGFVLVTRFDALELLIRPVQPWLSGGRLKYFSPADPFMVALRLAVAVGVVLALPIVLGQFWAFVSPILLPDERRAVLSSVFLGVGLFLGGMALAYFGVLPLTLRFFSTFEPESMRQNLTVGAFLGYTLKLVLGFGLAFETPVIMLVLGELGIVTSEMLVRVRRFAIVIIFVVGALLTPPDVFSQILMAGPLLVLYELSIFLVRRRERVRARRLADRQAEDGAARSGPDLPEATGEGSA